MNTTTNSLWNMCRTCMVHLTNTQKEDAVHKKQKITDIPPGRLDETILELLQVIQPQIKVTENDNMPMFVCSDCIPKILMAHEFIVMYTNVDKHLRDILDQAVCSKTDNQIKTECVIKDELQIFEVEDNTPVVKTENYIYEATKYEFEVKEISFETVEKEEGNAVDWLQIEDEPLHEFSNHSDDKEAFFMNPYSDDEVQDDEKESIFTNPNSDASDNEWKPNESCKKVTLSSNNRKRKANITTKRKKYQERIEIMKEHQVPEVINEDCTLTCKECEMVFTDDAIWKEHTKIHEDENHYAKINALRMRKKIRDDSNPLDLPEEKFISYFRLNKEAFCYLLDEIKDHLKTPIRVAAVPPILKLCAALRFFADGSYQKCSGNDLNIGVAQSTMSLILKEVLDVIELRVCPKWIKTQMSDEEINASKIWFFAKSGFPGVIGCIDCTHVRIVTPRNNIQHQYLNQKGYYSLNVMIMCDYKMNIRYVDARHPGATHDALIFNLSVLKTYLQRNVQENSWILGDSGYPLLPYLMTPFRMAGNGSPEARYNALHAKGRNIVERTIGAVKSKFRCLHSSRGLHYSPEKSTQIVNACCALHNISQHFKVQFEEIKIMNNSEDTTAQSSNSIHIEDTEVGTSIRNNIMRSFQS